MEERDDRQEGSHGSQEPGAPGPPPGARRDFEEKLDDIASKVSQTVSEGVKRLEEAASRIKERPEFYELKSKDFFSSPMGGVVVTIIGILWFFNAVGFFKNWVLALMVTAIGVYMIYKSKSREPRP